MRYELFHNVTACFLRKAEIGDHLIRGHVGDITMNERNILEAIFDRHNRDDRPDGQDAPSLSVGDVVVVYGTSPEGKAWTADKLGWSQVDLRSMVIWPGVWRDMAEHVRVIANPLID